ncbi:MAG: hypothetical protein IT576_13425 [Verrucomicrobiales bacterium]|nr:hypothetical protein [Verrucomicrobiales bacterium]
MRNVITLSVFAGVLAVAGSGQAQDKVNFGKQIWPFMKASCVDCHKPPFTDERGRKRKPKADLVITNKADFLKGGEDGAVIVAGDPVKSPFLQRTLLPLDHDDHMPPEGKADQWTDEQKKLFEQWIKEGADFGDWSNDPEVDKKG